MVKLNEKFSGVCPSCSSCTGMVMIDAFTGEYICARGCYHVEDYQRAYWERRDALQDALRRRAELHARFEKEREEARIRKEIDAINQVSWEEPDWAAGEFPRQYEAGWKIEFRKAKVDGKLIEQTRHIKGDRVLISTKGVVFPVQYLEANA